MREPDPIGIEAARSREDIETVRELFREYVESLGIDLSFQDVETEFADLPGRYAPPSGEILIARVASGRAVGCVAMRSLPSPGACEMKRLYLREEARGLRAGRRLADAIVAAAQSAGYDTMKLDSLPTMTTAQRLYRSLGFKPTGAYCANPVAGVSYMELVLKPV